MGEVKEASNDIDSKPPEPIRYDVFMSEFDEPREDDILRQTCKKCGIINEFVIALGWKLVKREDLQFLYDNVNTEDPSFIEYDEYKRIKEEYGIE